MSAGDPTTSEPSDGDLTTPAQSALAARRKPSEAFGNTAVPVGLKNVAGIIWRVLLILIAVALFVTFIGFLGGVALALFFSAIVAALGIPVQARLVKVMPNALATTLTLLMLFVGVSVVFAFILRSVITEASGLAAAAQQGLTQIEDWLKTGPLQMTDNAISQLLQQAQTWLSGEGVAIAKEVPDTLGNLGDFITAGSVAIFGCFFFINSGKEIWGWVMSWVPGHIRTEVDDCGQEGWNTLSGYTRGILIVAFFDGLLVGIGLQILVIGAPVATLFAAVVALATEGPGIALLVVGLTIVVGSFDGDIMQPLIMGHAVQLHPLAIVSAIAFGTLTFGIIGALIAVPILGTIYSIAKYLSGRSLPPRLVPPRERRKPRWPKFIRKHRHSTAPAPASST
jgi:predicted PurR-regulated permease PerM